MKNLPFVILALALVFVAVTLLAAAIQYSSGLIGVKGQPDTAFTSDINITGASNRTDNGMAGSDNDMSLSNTSLSLDLSQLPGMSNAQKAADDLLEDPPESLLYLIAVIIILLLALIGYLIWRRYRAKHKVLSLEDTESPEPEAVLEYHEGDYAINLPQIRASLPAIWGVDDKLEVIVRELKENRGDAALYVDGNASKDLEAGFGQVRVWLELEKGVHRIAVNPKRSGEASWADVRVVDYREEVVRMFNEMYRSYRQTHPGASKEMTARELELVMRQSLPEPMRKYLGDTVTLFEYANYSLHAIRRDEYETMYQSRTGLAQVAGGPHVNIE